MPERVARYSTVVLLVSLLSGCAEPSARPFVGSWTRDAAEFGVAHLTVRPTAAVELRLTSAPAGTPDTMRGPARFRGDTMIFKGAPCERGEARYLLRRTDSALVITALGTEGCATRHAVLAGLWTPE